MKTLGLIALFLSLTSGAVQIVSESSRAACEEFELSKELRIYKDPTLFVPNLSLIDADPSRGWESLMGENPLLTTVRGTVRLMRLGPTREFRGFGEIARLYEWADLKFKGRRTKKGKTEHVKIIPIKICGFGDAYSDTLGFVLEQDLAVSQTDDREDAGLPPSTEGRPVPKWPRTN